MKDALLSAVSDVEGYHHVITALDARKEKRSHLISLLIGYCMRRFDCSRDNQKRS